MGEAKTRTATKYGQALAAWKKQYLTAALKKYKTPQKTAEALGVSMPNFYAMMRRLKKATTADA